MRKHYTFIPLKETDLNSFRKALISTLWFRPFACLIALVILAGMGYIKRDVITSKITVLMLFSLAIGLVVYYLIAESVKLHHAGKIRKSSLLPFIHTRKEDVFFYSEETPNGFIIQTEPVNLVDISACKEEITLLAANCAASGLITYLDSCINSSDEKLINKAVIYTEIVKQQLEKGNKDILATCDKLVNCKEELL